MTMPAAVRPITGSTPMPSSNDSQYMTAMIGMKITAGTAGWTLEKKFRKEFSNRSGESERVDVRSDAPIDDPEW